MMISDNILARLAIHMNATEIDMKKWMKTGKRQSYPCINKVLREPFVPPELSIYPTPQWKGRVWFS
jgi:hypothetical protein